MKPNHLAAATLPALLALATGCGDPDCGPGTELVNGQCAPSADRCGEGTLWNPAIGQCEGPVCAAGTALIDGECVPDGSVLCGDGTTYDPETGTCMTTGVDCGPGTVLLGGECIPEDDALKGFVEEPPEPNQGEFAHPINPPADGSLTTISGCINPTADLDLDGQIDSDFDDYVMDMPGPALLRITVDGLGGLAGGFTMRSLVPQVDGDGWRRAGVSLVGDAVTRTVFVPSAGKYVLSVGDSRSILLDTLAGGEDTCYFVSIKRVENPTGVPLTGETTLALDATHFLDYQPQSDGAVLELTAVDDSAAAGPSFAVVANGQYVASATSNGGPIAANAGGLMTTDSVVVVVEPAFLYALGDVSTAVDFSERGSAALFSGAATTVTHEAGGNLLWFETPTGADLLGLDLENADDSIELRLLDRNLEVLATLCDGTPPCASASAVAQLPGSGRYYLEVINATSPPPGSEYDVSFETWFRAPEPLSVDGPIADRPLGDLGGDYFELTVADLSWLVTTGSATDFGGTMQVEIYLRSSYGVLGTDVLELDVLAFATGEEIYSRIEELDPGLPSESYLLRVVDSSFDGAADTEMYSLAVSSRDAEQIDFGVGGYVASAVDFEADQERLFFVRGTAGTRFRIETSNLVDADLEIAHLDAGEADVRVEDAFGTGEGEALSLFLRNDGWAALAVREVGGVAGTVDIAVTEEAADLTFTVPDELVAPDDGSTIVSELEVTDTCTIDAIRLDYAAFGAQPSSALEANIDSPGGIGFDLAPGIVNFAGSVPGHYDPMDDWTAFDAYSGTSASGTWTFTVQNPANAEHTGVSSWTLNLYCE